MKKNVLFSVSIVILLLGGSALNAGGNHTVKPDSKTIAVDTSSEVAKEGTLTTQYQGTHRIHRLRKFKRNRELGNGLMRMHRKYFIQ